MNKDEELIQGISKYSSQIGGFAGKYGNLVASCDGVGTKILLAQFARSYYSRPLQSVGIDCVAMVVNDLLCKELNLNFSLIIMHQIILENMNFIKYWLVYKRGVKKVEWNCWEVKLQN